MNVIADSLSRSRSPSSKWQINPRLFKHIFDLLPTLLIDLFATRSIAQIFLSPFLDKSAKEVVALSHSWDFLGVLYAFPPSPLLTAVLERIRATLHSVLC